MDDEAFKRGLYENYLLVEGSNDKHVFRHLLEYHQIPKRFADRQEYFDIRDHGGIDNLLNFKRLSTYLKVDDPRRVGIVVDTDTNPASRWRTLQDILKNSGYKTVPNTPKLEGTVLQEEGLPIVGIWLMPDNALPGILEDFVSLLVSPADALWPLAEDVLQKVVAQDCRFRPTYSIKAKLHTWLAWQEEPGTSLGLAITRRYLDATSPHAQHLIAWIRRLFDLESA